MDTAVRTESNDRLQSAESQAASPTKRKAAAKPGKAGSQRALSAVVCPLIARELPMALANFDLWETQLPPSVEPRGPSTSRPKLVFSFSCAPDDSLSIPLKKAFAEHPVVKRSFSKVEVLFCNLPPEKDLYIRNPTGPVPPYGNKSGPNWMFYETLRALRGGGGFIFLMETDCQPLVANWLKKLENTAARNTDAWIVGAHYSGASPLHWAVARHINGNAFYNVGDPDFWDFLDNMLWPWMHKYIQEVDPNLAYDCAWETFLSRPEMEHAGHRDWLYGRSVFHRFRLSGIVANIGGNAEQSGHYFWTREDLRRRFPMAAIAHGPVAASGRHRRGGLALGKVVRKGEVAVSAQSLSARGDLAAAMFERSIWIPDRLFDAGHRVTITFAVEGDPETFTIMELREPSGRLIVKKRVNYNSEKPLHRAKIEHEFTSTVNYIRCRIQFSGPIGASISITDIKCIIKMMEEIVARTARMLD
jgi:hypothetical protein